MALFYPHKGTVMIFLGCAVVVIGFATYVMAERNKVLLSFGSSESSQVKVVSNESQFASSTDWKKAFPVLADNSDSKSAKNHLASAESSAPETLTEQFGQSFFTKFMQLQQGGLVDSESAVKSTIDQTIDDLVFTAPEPKLYYAENVLTSPNVDPASVRAYGNAVGAIFITYGPRENSIEAATEILERNNMSAMSKIDSVINSYSTILKNLESMRVPESLSANHLALLNGVSSMLFVNQGLKNLDKDPVQSLLSLSIYNSAEEIFRESLIGLDDAFFMQGIEFTSAEPGRVFSTVP